MAFLVTEEMKVDVSKITIEEQLELCRLLIKSGYVVERKYRVKEKGFRRCPILCNFREKERK